jgi:hypothetical protein
MASGDSCNHQPVGEECTAVVGSGLHITSISGTFKDHSSSIPADGVVIEFYGPNGYITKTAPHNVPAGGSIGPFVWHNPNPTANMTPGDYCTEDIGGHADCIDVHS